MHPAFGFNYERIVGPSGATICGTFVPGGTIVGVNPWVVQRDTGVYGLDAHTYRPERWLEASDAKVKEMGRMLVQFGAGEHICLGKNISILEMYKLVPSLLRSFHVSVCGLFDYCFRSLHWLSTYFAASTSLLTRLTDRARKS
jgi:hypothetical protein